MIVLNDLLGYKNRMIYQDTEYFKFSLDGVLLANFVEIKLTTKKILDIGTGTGVIPLILSKRTSKKIEAIEIQKELCDLFCASIEYNHLQNQLCVFNGDIKKFTENEHNINKYDIIVSNPPYFSGSDCKNIYKNIARNEQDLSLEDVIVSSKKLLKDKGSLYLVYPSSKFIYLLKILEKNKLIPKKVQFVYHTSLSKSNIFLIKCGKNAKEGLEIMNPLILYKQDGKMTAAYKKIYDGK